MTLEVSTITTQGELDALTEPWRGLLGRIDNDLPFLLPEWASTWWRCFRQEAPLIRDSLRVKVVRDGDALLGILPLMLTERPPVGPLRATALGFLGANRYVTELRAPIVDPAREGEVARALAAHLLADRSWDWVAWQGLDRASELARELDRAMPLRWSAAPEVASVLHLPATWDEFRGGLKRNIKESLRRCTNSLKRDGLRARLVVAQTPADVDRALDTFLALHGMRARDDEAPSHPDRFEGDRPRRFLRQLSEQLSARGEVRVLSLLVDGKAVAARVAFQLPHCLYLYYSGFDPAWGKYSVATTLVAEAIKDAIARGVPRVHLSMGQDVSKSRWGPRTSERHGAVWVSPRRRSRAAYWLYATGKDSKILGGTAGRLLPRRHHD